MKHISSRDNPAVKALVKLAGLAGRRGASVLLDGVHLCRAWLDHHGLPEQAVFDAERLTSPNSRLWPPRCRPSAAWRWTRA